MIKLTIIWTFIVLYLYYKLELKDRFTYGVGKPYELIDLWEEIKEEKKKNG
tara:strand:+ start:100 stop:252 length:153 start_codon:yes stop_codon:yes gene_type:complete